MRRLSFQAHTDHMTRREMLQLAAGVGTGLVLGKPGAAVAGQPSHLFALDLAGDMWTMRAEGQSPLAQTVVPGSTYTNLLRAGTIPEPFYGEDNGKVQWVADKDWTFERTFEAPDDLRAKQRVQLVCHGLDTLATLWLNGREIGQANNMFRTWTFDVKPHIRRGTNHLRIQFDTLAPYVEEQRQSYKQAFGIDLDNPRSWVRKAPYMWGWDWCRPILTQGIWKKIEILGFDSRIAELGVLQSRQPDGSALLEIHVLARGRQTQTAVKAQVSLAGTTVATASAPVNNGRALLRTAIHNPQLWWPNGMGDQPLYTVTAQLTDSNGQDLDVVSRRVGLRTVEVLPPADGVAMHVRINGVPVFAKGADWIPADNMPTRVTPEILRWYMTRAVECNFNFIRLWGGGYYEEDELFEVCDELGIMLQFEFKFANASYPVRGQTWMANLRAEIEQQIRRCRNHPSIVIWSGNNEIEYFDGYYQLFRDAIGGIVHRLVPGAFYEVGSGAHGSGDIHTWGVWHGDKPVESYRSIEGFVTEFGMQSFPVPMTVDSYTSPADRQSVHSPVMRYHELDGSGHGIGIIMHYTEADFGKAPDNFDDALWLTQLNQSWSMRYGVEHWRRQMPRSMASTIWQYNDCWPGATWAMVDYFRRWKAVLYESKHFFAPILVSGVPDPQTGQAEIYITSDRQDDGVGELRWCVTNLTGEVLRQGSKQAEIPARTSRQAEVLDLGDLVKAHGASNLLIWPEVMVDDLAVAENTLLFGRPAELKLKRPKLMVTSSGGDRRYDVLIEADVPALWVWVNLKETDAQYSDNFLHLRPGRAAMIRVVLKKPMSPFDFRRTLEVRSVYDIAPEMRSQGG
jgi:beta-mannosidase